MDGIRSNHIDKDCLQSFRQENLKERDQSGYLDVDGRVMLKYIFNK
jgi:hypothetical protein